MLAARLSKIGFLSSEGDLLESWSIPTDLRNHGDNILFDIAESIKKFMTMKSVKDSDIIGYGFGLPGPVLNDVAIKCPNLGWENVNVPEAFEALMVKQCLSKLAMTQRLLLQVNTGNVTSKAILSSSH